MQQVTPDQILDRAANHVENGWIKNREEDNWGNVCAIGGIGKAARMSAWGWEEDRLKKEATKYLIAHLRRHSFVSLVLGCFAATQERAPITAFNDAPWRRKATVVRRLRGAAKRYRRAHVEERINELVWSATRSVDPADVPVKEQMVTVPVSELDYLTIDDIHIEEFLTEVS